MIMLGEPYYQKIVDFTQPIFFEDPVIITRFIDSYSSADFDQINIFDKSSWIVFTTLIIHTIILITIFDRLFLANKSSMFQRISTASVGIFSTIIGRGEINQFVYCYNYYSKLLLQQANIYK